MTGAELKRLREAHGLNQVQLGEVLGVTGTSVSNWEAGKAPIPRWLEKTWRLFFGKLEAERRAEVDRLMGVDAAEEKEAERTRRAEERAKAAETARLEKKRLRLAEKEAERIAERRTRTPVRCMVDVMHFGDESRVVASLEFWPYLSENQAASARAKPVYRHVLLPVGSWGVAAGHTLAPDIERAYQALGETIPGGVRRYQSEYGARWEWADAEGADPRGRVWPGPEGARPSGAAASLPPLPH